MAVTGATVGATEGSAVGWKEKKVLDSVAGAAAVGALVTTAGCRVVSGERTTVVGAEVGRTGSWVLCLFCVGFAGSELCLEIIEQADYKRTAK